MKPVVFAGPSIHGIGRRDFPDLDFRPPAAAGDILRAVADGASVIGLIDGVYENTAAVWHKEILYALSKGVAVCGAASMGALRAAECRTFGMIGLGRVFDDYVSGHRTSDADVAVTHGPAELDHMPLSVALVDAEETISVLAGHMPDEKRMLLLDAARALHFSQRTWKAIAGLVEREGDADAMAEMLRKHHRSVKREDAMLLLRTIASQDLPVADIPSWSFEETVFFSQLERRLARA
jgi:hypothetical protein